MVKIDKDLSNNIMTDSQYKNKLKEYNLELSPGETCNITEENILTNTIRKIYTMSENDFLQRVKLHHHAC